MRQGESDKIGKFIDGKKVDVLMNDGIADAAALEKRRNEILGKSAIAEDE